MYNLFIMKKIIIPIGILILIALFFVTKNKPVNEDVIPENLPYIDMLNTAEISIPELEQIEIRLSDGSSEFTIPDTTATGFATLDKNYTIWKKDTQTDLTTILNVNYGGSGTFQYLVLFNVSDNFLTQKSQILLGDHISVTNIGVGELVHDPKANYRLTVKTLIRNDNEPFATPPTKPKTRTFYITDQILEEIEVGRDDS